MGDANTGRTSKGKGVLGGLVGSLKRVAGGGKKNTEEAAPRTGVSLRDRFSALEPSAAPTDPVPQKISEDIPEPDRKEVKVIHTSSVRSSGSVKFSDRIGLAVASEAEDGYDRKITFDDCDGSVSDVPEEYDDVVEETVITDNVVFDDDDIDAEVLEEEEAEAQDNEETIVEYTEVEPEATMEEVVEEEVFEEEVFEEDVVEEYTVEEVTNVAEEPAEVVAEPIMPIEEPIMTEVVAEERTTVREKEEGTIKAKPPAINTAPSDDGFDEGYDFLPRRGVSDRFAGMERKTTGPVRETAIPLPVEKAVETKESTALAERMRAKHAESAQRRPAEIQMDGPVQHAGMSRTSLLERVTREKAPGKSMSDIILEAKCIEAEEKAAPVVIDEIEECDADVSAATLEIPKETIIYDDAEEEAPAEIAVAAEAECVEDIEIFNETTEEDDEEDEVIPEAADTEAADDAAEEYSEAIEADAVIGTEEIAEAAFEAAEVETEDEEAEAIPEITEVGVEAEEEVTEVAPEITEVGVEAEEEVTEADVEFTDIDVEEDVETIPEAEEEIAIETEVEAEEFSVAPEVIEAEIRTEDTVFEEITAELPDLTEIDDDLSADIPDALIDEAEERMRALLTGVVVDDGVIPAEDVPAEICAAEPIPADDTERNDEAFAMCFSFLSEETPEPSANVRFVWGQ